MDPELEKVEPGDSEQDEEEDVYEVERIIDMRVEEGEVLYRVRWKNYCSDDDTWEPEAHLEDCREVLLAYKKSLAEAKAKKEAEAKKVTKLPTKTDVFDADSESDSDKDRAREMPVKKKKKKKIREEVEDEPLMKEKRKKKKDKKKDEVIRPLPAPETDEEVERAPTPPIAQREKKAELKKRAIDSDEDDDDLVPVKKHKKDKGKHKKEKAEEGKKRKGKKEHKVPSSEDEAIPPLEDDLSTGPSETQMDDPAPFESPSLSTERARSDDKSKLKKGKAEQKLRGTKAVVHDKKGKRPDVPSPTPLKEGSLQKLKKLTAKSRDDAALHSSDSSDSSTRYKKAKSKGQETALATSKVPSSSASSSSSSSAVTASISTKTKEDDPKEDASVQRDSAASTNLFEKFLLNCEAKDRAPRKHVVHQPSSTESSRAAKVAGRVEKKTKLAKESPSQKTEAEKVERTRQSDGTRPGQSYGFSLDSDEKEGEELMSRSRFAEDAQDRRDRAEDAQRASWDHRNPTDERRRRREDSEARLFMACDDNLDVPESLDSSDKSDKGQALSLGLDLNLDWMTLEDFQKHLNGEDEILSGPPLSPSELRDAVKSGDYMSVKLALNSKEDYNLDQEACTIDEKKSVEEQKSLIEDRATSDEFRLGLDMDNIPRDFGDLTDHENIPKDFNTNPKEEALGEDGKMSVAGSPTEGSPDQHSSESNATSSDAELENGLGEAGSGGSCLRMNLNFHHDGSSVIKNSQRMHERSPMSDEEEMDVRPNWEDDDQNQVENENGVYHEAETGERCNFNGTDYLSMAEDCPTANTTEVNSQKPAKARTVRRKKPGEGKQPTRSSSRTSKKVLVNTSSGLEDDDEVASKKHHCLYCKAAFTHLVKHLERKHSDETDVAQAIHFPKGSKIRQTLLDQIRSKGDYQYNCEVLKNGEGEMVAKKQATDSTISVRDFLPCQHCFAFYRKTELWKHERSCKVKKGEQRPMEVSRCRAQSAAPRLPQTTEFLTGGCDEIIDIMHQDDVSRHVRNDPLICKYGNALSAKHDHDKSQYAYIAQKMRELGRFVLAVNELDSTIQYLHEICTPSKFDLAIEGAKKVSGFDPNSSKFKTVSLVSKIGYSLKRAAEIAFGESRMTEDSETEAQVKKFIHLLDTEWHDRFSRRALISANRRQEFKKVELDKSTLAEDVIKLHKLIRREGDEANKELKDSPNPSTWRKLSEATLTDVCLFNRGRVGNIGRMLLETYTNRKSKMTFVPSADQIMKSTKLELELGESFTRLELEGQCGRNMLVLLTERMVASMDLLIEKREEAGVQQENPYVFARSEGPSYIRGSDCFRRAAHDCKAKNPEALLSSVVREQIASYWQLISLCETELDQVAKLLGRSSQEFYKLSENPVHLEEVTKQLLKMERTIHPDPSSTTRDGTVPVSVTKKKAWSEKEQAAVKRYLGNFFTLMKVPGKKECNACIAAESALSGRSWTDVKSYVHNTLQAIRKKYYQRKNEGDVLFLKRPKGDQARKTDLLGDKKPVDRIMTTQPNHYRGETSSLSLARPMAHEMGPMVSTYSPMASNSSNMLPTNRQMISSFTPLNASDTITPTYTQMNARNASYSRNIPTFTPLNAPSPPMVPTFTPLNARNTSMISSYTPLNHSNTPMVPTFTPLNHSGTSPYHAGSPMGPASPLGVPTGAPVLSNRAAIDSHLLPTSAPMVPEITRSVQTSTLKPASQAKSHSCAVKAQKRTKRLWCEEEQMAVKRQLGDLCKLEKVPGKKECDSCIAAEPALRSRTWREVKYYVHNTIQSMKKRGTAPNPKRIGDWVQDTPNPSVDWDAPVYLSL